MGVWWLVATTAPHHTNQLKNVPWMTWGGSAPKLTFDLLYLFSVENLYYGNMVLLQRGLYFLAVCKRTLSNLSPLVFYNKSHKVMLVVVRVLKCSDEWLRTANNSVALPPLLQGVAATSVAVVDSGSLLRPSRTPGGHGPILVYTVHWMGYKKPTPD